MFFGISIIPNDEDLKGWRRGTGRERGSTGIPRIGRGSEPGGSGADPAVGADAGGAGGAHRLLQGGDRAAVCGFGGL